jgi:hypothetical protein
MEWVDRATLAKQQGNTVLEMECLTSAFEQERSAADLVADRLGGLPTRAYTAIVIVTQII